jgi:hypothetical protein
VIVRINGAQTNITGGVAGIHARLGLGTNTFLAGTGVNASMTVSGSPGNDTIVTGGRARHDLWVRRRGQHHYRRGR